MSDLHVFRGGGLPDDDPMAGLTPRPFSVRMDYRCAMPYRVFEARYDYDQTTTWEVGRFANAKDADLFLQAVGGRLVKSGARFPPERDHAAVVR